MATSSVAVTERVRSELDNETVAEARHQRWAHVHVNWTAVWVGALVALSALLILGLVGIALGAHLLTPENRVVDLKKMGVGTLIFSVCSAFFAFVGAGWVAGKIAGVLHSEPAMIHGAVVWLVTVPILLAGAGLGASSALGGWYGGLSPNTVATSTAPFTRPDPLTANATADEIATYKTQQAEYARNVKQWQDDTPRVTRNSALGTITALLLGLLGSALGGWMASGEPMNFTHYKSRKPIYYTP